MPNIDNLYRGKGKKVKTVFFINIESKKVYADHSIFKIFTIDLKNDYKKPIVLYKNIKQTEQLIDKYIK